MKKIKVITFFLLGTITVLAGGFLVIYNLIATNEKKPQPTDWYLKNNYKISFKVKNNLLLLSKNIIPDQVIVVNNHKKYRLIDIIFEYRIPLYRFRPLTANKLQQVIFQDIVIELEPFAKDIACFFINDVNVKSLRRIFNFEIKILEGIVEILLSSFVISERFEILKQYLIDNNFEKYYQTILQIICT